MPPEAGLGAQELAPRTLVRLRSVIEGGPPPPCQSLAAPATGRAQSARTSPAWAAEPGAFRRVAAGICVLGFARLRSLLLSYDSNRIEAHWMRRTLINTAKEINAINREFWARQNVLMEQRMADDAVRRVALARVESECSRGVPINRRLLATRFPDQPTDLQRDARSPTAPSGFPTPEGSKPSPVPTNHGLRPDDGPRI